MTTRRPTIPPSAVLLALLVTASCADAAGIGVKLDEELARRAGTNTVALEPDANATVIDGPGAPGVLPAVGHPAARLNMPPAAWPVRRGTLMMRIKTSRRLGFVPEGRRIVRLVGGPLIEVELGEYTDCPRFVVRPPGEGKRTSRVCRVAYLLPDRWYHFAVSWNAEAGDVDLFLNGWAQQRVHLPKWKPLDKPAQALELGGVVGEGDDAAAIAVSAVELHAWAMDEARLRTYLKGQTFFDLAPHALQRLEDPLDLTPYALTTIYEPDFGKGIDIVKEETLFDGDERAREPEPEQWVLEGPAEAFIDDGELVIDNLTMGPKHTVLWLPRVFPSSFMLEFDITLEEADEGLAIVFFAARPRDAPDASIFQPGLAKREGLFRNYIVGDVNSYHVSYLAADKTGQGLYGPRRTANVRKNSGFWLVACGEDQIQGKGLGRGPHRVRILKDGPSIRVEANGRLSVAFDDDGKAWGPVWGDGYIGLRQMNHTRSGRYRDLRVYAVQRKR